MTSHLYDLQLSARRLNNLRVAKLEIDTFYDDPDESHHDIPQSRLYESAVEYYQLFFLASFQSLKIVEMVELWNPPASMAKTL